MPSLLFGICLSAVLSTTSLLIVLLRVSPLTAPAQAIPAFFLSTVLSVCSVSALAFFGCWKILPTHTWDTGKILSISLRQGIMLGGATMIVLLFHLLSLLTWWIAVMIYSVFLLVELALDH